MTLMPEFRRQLLEAAEQRPPTRAPLSARLPALRLPRPSPGLRLGTGLAGAASILVVVAVVAALLTVGRPDHHARPAGARRGAQTPDVARARAQLLGELGVLRRGHAARLASADALAMPHPQIDRSLVRIVRSRGYQVTLVPLTVRAPGSSHRAATTDLVVTVRGPKVNSGFPAIGDRLITLGNPVSPATIARQGAIFIMYVRGALNRAVVVVPDGVTRVELSRFTPDRSRGARPVTLAPASAPVHDNVAVLSLPGVTAAALHQTQTTVRDHGGLFSSHHCRINAVLYFVPGSIRMTWHRQTAAGDQVRVTTVQTSLNAYSTTLLPPPLCHRRR